MPAPSPGLLAGNLLLQRWGAPGEDQARGESRAQARETSSRVPHRRRRCPLPPSAADPEHVRNDPNRSHKCPGRTGPSAAAYDMEGHAMSDPTPNWSFETCQIHVGQAGRHRRASPADLPDHVLRLQGHGPRRQSLCPQRVRQHLHPHHEPHPGRGGAAHRLLEGGVGALLVASGQAAETIAISTSPRPVHHVVASPSLYGGTFNLLAGATPSRSSASR